MLKTREEIEKYMERFGGMDDWTINDKGEVDVPGNIKLQRSFFPEGKFPFQFGTVKGSFDCSNASLKSLIGSPHTVEGDFECYENELTSLEGAPSYAGRYIDFSDNNITTLDGLPEIVLQGVFCYNNPLQALGNANSKIGSWLRSPPIPELSAIAEINHDGNYKVSAEDFYAKVLELKRIREEKALLESSIARVLDARPLGSTTPHVAEPQLQQRAKPKFKL